ncbi:DUF982 domain-containing protein [Mesorhizobium sp. YC-39]|uniref:DUF982 domain-containing protein n=1 Tax=unclassified Mesorhizobium TaxID=325217 RepID=UPI0021E7FC9E|nr:MULTISPECIES: DUF982 domain-containing protein [unclassified Mesorhizobium]MCV3210935.1 DUF982 domain-containing protein [Mesorhizobium sp. YC-2]MCV3231169.1 DUF982 domain-containing protein [Mesorhizobium sp. YC-39]
MFDSSRGYAMNQGWFSRPVPVSIGIAGATRNILSAQQAVELLSGDWRDAGSLQHSSALRACRRAMSGDVPAEAAREAFVGAAREAHILVE